MTILQDFINEYNDKKVGSGQCVALCNAWLTSNSHPEIMGNAITWPTEHPAGYEYIANTPEGVPQTGDIVCFNYQPDGHVSIFISGDTTTFESFDQNFPLEAPCEKVAHNYLHVTGWLRPVAAEFPKTVETTVDLNVRAEPNATAHQVANYKAGTTVTVIAEVAGGEYEINGQTSSQWYETSGHEYIAALGVK